MHCVQSALTNVAPIDKRPRRPPSERIRNHTPANSGAGSGAASRGRGLLTVAAALVTGAGDQRAIFQLHGFVLGRPHNALAQELLLAPGLAIVRAALEIALPCRRMSTDLQGQRQAGSIRAAPLLKEEWGHRLPILRLR